MNNPKLKVAIIAGGKSAEHEVSLVSAKNILSAIDKSIYEPILIGISKRGEWYYCPNWDWLPQMPGYYKETVEQNGIPIAIIPADPNGQFKMRECRIDVKKTDSEPVQQQEKRQDTEPLNEVDKQNKKFLKVDCAFPIIHGPLGEDGALQGLLKLLEIPFVGPDVMSSAICMDKVAMKKILQQSGIQTSKYFSFDKHERSTINIRKINEEIGFPAYVKPANMGSSVGVSKAKNEDQLHDAIDMAFRYDNKILIEQEVRGRELECAVLGNEEPSASSIGEVKGCEDNFYSYDAKYINEDGAQLIIPADLTEIQKNALQQLAVKTYKAMFCRGMARVDMFLTEQGDIYVNELNTLPGFTRISMYPSLWMDAGVKYPELIDKLIKLAIKAGTGI